MISLDLLFKRMEASEDKADGPSHHLVLRYSQSGEYFIIHE